MLTRTISLPLTALFLLLPLSAQSRRSAAPRKPAHTVKPLDDSTTPPSNWEVLSDITVAANGSYMIDSQLDYSSAAKVAVSLLCSSCTSDTSSISALTVQAFWSVPEAGYYGIYEFRSGSQFPYWDAGGVLFEVFGSQLKLNIQNTSAADITLSQVIIFRRQN